MALSDSTKEINVVIADKTFVCSVYYLYWRLAIPVLSRVGIREFAYRPKDA